MDSKENFLMEEGKLIGYLKHQSFHPSLFSLFIHPFYFIRRDLYKNIKRLAPQLKGKLLDFGCGRKPYEPLFSVDEYIGIDIQKSGHDHSKPKVDVYYDGQHIPFPDASFDSLFCSEVVEHIFNPNEILQEINRVLKPGGHFSISDIVLEGELPTQIKEAAEMYAGCIAGAIQKRMYLELIESNGFKNITVQKDKAIIIPDDILSNYLSVEQIAAFKQSDTGIRSITVYAEKPLEDKRSCCGPDCCN